MVKSYRADLIAGKKFEDFLEVVLSEDNDVLSVKYGINRYLNEGDTPSSTIIREVAVEQQIEYK